MSEVKNRSFFLLEMVGLGHLAMAFIVPLAAFVWLGAAGEENLADPLVVWPWFFAIGLITLYCLFMRGFVKILLAIEKNTRDTKYK